MKVKAVLDLLSTMPPDADFVASTDGIQATAGKGVMRENSPPLKSQLVSGFSAEELAREEYEVFFFENDGLVVLALVKNSAGGYVK